MTGATTVRHRARAPDAWIFYGFLALLLWLPLPWGSHSDWAVYLAGSVSFALLAAWLTLAGISGRLHLAERGGRLLLGFALWLAWLVWIGRQALDVPSEVLRSWAPTSVEMRAELEPLDGGTAATFSIAPGLTLTKLVESLVYLSLYALAFLTVRGERRVRQFLMALFAAGVVQAAYGGFMALSGLDYGWLAKKAAYLGSATGTFVNRNHLAGYLELTAAAGLALILADLRAGSGRWSWHRLLDGLMNLALSRKLQVRLALIVIAIGLVATRSRMGNAAFLLSISLGGLLYVVLRERALFLRALLLFGSILAVDVLIVAEQFGLERVAERVQATRLEDEGRALLLQQVGPAIDDYGVAGSGLGTFAIAFEPYRQDSLREYFDHAHNDYVEFLVETGYLGLGLVLGLVALHVVHALRIVLRRRNRVPMASGVAFLIATLALGVHAVTEFNFQIPAIAGSYVALMGMIAATSRVGRRRRRVRPPEQLQPQPAGAQ